MSSYRFDADDLSLGHDYAVFAKGSRRVELSNLHPAQISALRASFRAGKPRHDLGAAVVDRLASAGLLTDRGELHPARIVRLRLPSCTVTSLARLLIPLGSDAGILALLLLWAATIPLVLGSAIGEVAFNGPSSMGLLWLPAALALFYLTALIHELGHAAVCLRLTGAVGGIRFGRSGIALLMAIDVSSSHRTDARGRARIAVAGPAFQLGAAAMSALAWRCGALDGRIALVIWAAAGLAAFHSLVPAPGNDGSSLMRELAGVDVSVSTTGNARDARDARTIAMLRIVRALLLVATGALALIVFAAVI